MAHELKCWNCGSDKVVHHDEVVGKGNAHYKCEACGATGEESDFQPGSEAHSAHVAAKKKTYLDAIETMLDHGFGEADAEDARERGNDLSDLTQALSEDGSFTRHVGAAVQNRREHVAKKLSDDNILNDLELSEREAKSNKDGLQHAANEKAVISAIDALLRRGVEPKRIQAALDKYAELNLWNRQWATDTLNRRSNELGMNYLQPNTFMDKLPDTYERVKPTKLSSVHVAVEADEVLSLSESKFGGEARKRARPIEVSTSEVEREHQAHVQYERRANEPTRGAGERNKTASVHQRTAEAFDAGKVAELRVTKPFEQIWREACQQVGLHLASKAFHEYASAAKRQGVKFAAKDAEFFGARLGIKGLQVAAAKPAIPHIAYDSGKQGSKAKDGNELLKEFEVAAPATPDIEYQRGFEQVENKQAGLEI